MNVIEVRNLYFSYHDRVILEDINLAVEKGEYLTSITFIFGFLPYSANAFFKFSRFWRIKAK